MADFAGPDVGLAAQVFGFPWVQLDTDPLRILVAWTPPKEGRAVNRNALTWPSVNAAPGGFTTWDSPEGGQAGFPGKVTLTERFVPGDTLQIPEGALEVTV